MRDNVITHLVITASNIMLIFSFGRFLNGLGVIMAWALAVALGGCVLNFLFYRINEISFTKIIPKGSRWLAVSCLIGLFACYTLWFQSTKIMQLILSISTLSGLREQLIVGSLMTFCFLFIIGLPIWNNPIRKKIINLIVNIRAK